MAQMPEQVVFEQTKIEIANVINQSIQIHNLPVYQIAIILKDFYNEAQAQAQNEYKFQFEQYQMQLRKEQESKEQPEEKSEN